MQFVLVVFWDFLRKVVVAELNKLQFKLFISFGRRNKLSFQTFYTDTIYTYFGITIPKQMIINSNILNYARNCVQHLQKKILYCLLFQKENMES